MSSDWEQPTKAQIKRWRKHLANERAEADVYRALASRKEGEEREILLAIAEAESRHEQHWLRLLGPEARSIAPDISTQVKGFFARHFGSVFALALMQSAESRSPYLSDADATAQMSADERIHAEVVRGLAARGREQMSGNFRAAVFGMNDGLVSNLALVLGIAGSGVSNHFILLTGFSGLLAGALSMGAGEYVSVSSQRELLDASTPNPDTAAAIPQLDVNANELELVYRARGMSAEEARSRARTVLSHFEHPAAQDSFGGANNEVVGSGFAAAWSSFLFFASGALIPILPFLWLSTSAATILACVLVGIALMLTGGIVGVLSGAPPLRRALRQLAIGLGAAGVTYALGMLFGTSVS
ncbi:VIT1/CCC1 transporter family protein [Corynebacterium epidermidicanis]|uniref:Putative membrane protein n=1 Tax=Corynebacterium epidermidicanis TaxID=1050174 RepID=A0A0G3GVU8_9CORY|nr:VIT1/CCC1 transporter family protein [Corynebacterium epidermidicanis]AKK03628.1 putative membrane protein [Corynebacterium epidermidicanis]